jgi:hypothetical protein
VLNRTSPSIKHSAELKGSITRQVIEAHADQAEMSGPERAKGTLMWNCRPTT